MRGRGIHKRRPHDLREPSPHEELAMTKAVKPSKVRIGLETAIASFAGALGVLTIFWHDWIEALTGWDPDHHNGSFEWMIVAVLLIVAAVVGATARRDWRLRAAASQSPS
jgi:undecaprenyl pyrophosphate phosphatase UppP